VARSDIRDNNPVTARNNAHERGGRNCVLRRSSALFILISVAALGQITVKNEDGSFTVRDIEFNTGIGVSGPMHTI
jgi:hypothetical protein